MLRPHDGDTLDFDAGYIRHLEYDRQAKDTDGWSIWAEKVDALIAKTTVEILNLRPT